MISVEVNNKNYPIFKSRQTEMERLVLPVDIKTEKRAKIRGQKYFIDNPFCDSLNSVIMKLWINCFFLTHALPKCYRKLAEIC